MSKLMISLLASTFALTAAGASGENTSEYQVARERCDALTGAMKVRCINDANLLKKQSGTASNSPGTQGDKSMGQGPGGAWQGTSPPQKTTRSGQGNSPKTQGDKTPDTPSSTTRSDTTFGQPNPRADRDVTYQEQIKACSSLMGEAKMDCVIRVRKQNEPAIDGSGGSTTTSRGDASINPNETNYQLDVQKCDSMTGSTKELCIRDAKQKHNLNRNP